MTTAEIATLPEAISLLSSMYCCKPIPAVVEQWKKALSGDTSIFLGDLKKAVADIDTASDKEMEELLWEYTRLFIGPYKLPCPPWESVYTSPKRLMMQEAAGELMTLYHKAGLALETAVLMPDHIGAELNFLAVLLERMHPEGREKDGSSKIVEKLLNEHLLKWTPDFTRDMEDAAESPLYKALARETRTVIAFVGRS
jgi:TorA maturation chaperone TorD